MAGNGNGTKLASHCVPVTPDRSRSGFGLTRLSTEFPFLDSPFDHLSYTLTHLSFPLLLRHRRQRRRPARLQYTIFCLYIYIYILPIKCQKTQHRRIQDHYNLTMPRNLPYLCSRAGLELLATFTYILQSAADSTPFNRF